MGYYLVRAGETASGRDPLAADRVERFFTATLAYLRAHPDAVSCFIRKSFPLLYLMDAHFGIDYFDCAVFLFFLDSQCD